MLIQKSVHTAEKQRTKLIGAKKMNLEENGEKITQTENTADGGLSNFNGTWLCFVCSPKGTRFLIPKDSDYGKESNNHYIKHHFKGDGATSHSMRKYKKVL